MRARIGAIAAGTLAATMVALTAQTASATVAVDERTVEGPAGQPVRALVLTDVVGLSDRIQISPHFRDPGVVSISQHAPGTVLGPAPVGCRREVGTLSSHLDCPLADYDVFLIGLGGGDDNLHVGFPYPRLTRKQIGSGQIPILMGVTMGPGDDDFTPGIGTGTNLVRGQGGRDELAGSAANDILVGGSGRDKLFGSGGKDLVFGGKGSDAIYGGRGVPDFMIGGRGRDLCVGQDRGDRVGGCERLRLE
jgi:hypothetical protein